MSLRFDSPKVILTGGGSRKRAAEMLSTLGARRVLLVIDPYFSTGAGLLPDLRTALAAAGIASEVFSDFQPDPTDANVIAGAGQLKAFGGDAILAVAGGSAIDVAKVIGAAAANAEPLRSFQGYERIPRAGPPLIAIPTTAGTGSEATKV